MMRRYWSIVLLIIICLGMGGCSKHNTTPVTKAKPVAAKPVSAPESLEAVTMDQAKNVPTGAAFQTAYKSSSIKAVVKPYAVKPDLSNISNRKLFGPFTPEQKALLSKNAFFAAPTTEQQLFFIYEQNDYKNIPSFITTDSVLQVYHIFYDFTLRSLETGKLYDILQTLSDSMMSESMAVAAQMTKPEWKKAALSNQVYFAVPESCLGKKVTLSTPDQRKVLAKELDLVNKAPGRVQSALFPWKPDYSQFKPRGHYTRSEKLKKYFRAMMWYGYQPFPAIWPIKGYDGEEEIGGPALPQIRQALLITKMLFNTKIHGRLAIKTWESIYEPTIFYVGTSDDITPYQYKKIMDKVYGAKASYSDLQDEAKLKEVYAELRKLPRPRIDVRLEGMPSGRMLKFMGQRYIPDSRMLQRLVNGYDRHLPKGLDVLAVLGSERAADILDNVYHEPETWDLYLPHREELIKEFKALPPETWRSNLYWGWMWSLDTFTETFGDGYPSFMTNQAWVDKSLNTALGSWAELRHDTILYAKQSGAECGGDGEPPPVPKGYVEPNVEFYNRMLWLTTTSREGLDARGLLTDNLKEKFTQFEDLLTFLRNVSIKELTNQKLTQEEYRQIKYYGSEIERLTLSVINDQARGWFDVTSEADKHMAVVADVHTWYIYCLEEAVGCANEIYVVVPIEGKLWLTRGAIFSYYEFQQPLKNRLTDEQWQKMLKEGKTPPVPVWVDSFLQGKQKKSQVLPKRAVRSTGC